MVIVFAVGNLLSAVTGITSVSGGSDTPTVVTRHGLFGRLFVLAMSAVFGTGYAVLRKRTALSWRIGWVLLAASLVDFLYVVLVSPGFASSFAIIGGTAVIIFWGIWWWRQRPEYVGGEDAKA
ncbi:MAG: hypothetical protein ACR2ID_10840 [Chthoniobacterales bacterium]